VRRARRRGFTLIELLAYIALVTAAMIVIAGIEVTASHAAFLERALIDLALDGDALEVHLRDDLRQATRVEPAFEALSTPKLHGTLLVVGTPSGGEIRYEIESAKALEAEPSGAGVRAESPRLVRRTLPRPGAPPVRTEVFARIEKLHVGRELHGGRALYRFEMTLAYAKGDETTARRTYSFAASPLAQEAP
jgi:type II secretory pathway pseudopilin PulG